MDETLETVETVETSGETSEEILSNIEGLINDIYGVQNAFYNDIISILLFTCGILIGGFALKTFWEASSKW